MRVEIECEARVKKLKNGVVIIPSKGASDLLASFDGSRVRLFIEIEVSENGES